MTSLANGSNATFTTESETDQLLASTPKAVYYTPKTAPDEETTTAFSEPNESPANVRRRLYQSGPRISSYGSMGSEKGNSAISLSWENVNVFLPAVKKWPCGTAQKQPPRHILRDGK